MPITPEKQAAVAKLKEKLSQAKGAVLADYRGITVVEDTALRHKLREAAVDYQVVKNTFTRIAAGELGLKELESYLAGPTALAVSYTDPVAPAKVLVDFAKEHKQFAIKAGLVEGRVIGLEDVKALANLPPREVLLAKMLGSMQAPLSGLANVLQGSIRNLVYTLDAVRQQKETA